MRKKREAHPRPVFTAKVCESNWLEMWNLTKEFAGGKEKGGEGRGILWWRWRDTLWNRYLLWRTIHTATRNPLGKMWRRARRVSFWWVISREQGMKYSHPKALTLHPLVMCAVVCLPYQSHYYVFLVIVQWSIWPHMDLTPTGFQPSHRRSM